MRISKNDTIAFPRFCLVSKKETLLDSLCFMVGNSLEYLIGILNSKLSAFYFFNKISVLDNGGMQMRQQFVENFPVPNIGDTLIEKEIANFVNENIKKGSSQENTKLIDNLIYRLYNISNEEITFIDNYINDKMKQIMS